MAGNICNAFFSLTEQLLIHHIVSHSISLMYGELIAEVDLFIRCWLSWWDLENRYSKSLWLWQLWLAFCFWMEVWYSACAQQLLTWEKEVPDSFSIVNGFEGFFCTSVSLHTISCSTSLTWIEACIRGWQSINHYSSIPIHKAYANLLHIGARTNDKYCVRY